jgi:hypothetical protein
MLLQAERALLLPQLSHVEHSHLYCAHALALRTPNVIRPLPQLSHALSPQPQPAACREVLPIPISPRRSRSRSRPRESRSRSPPPITIPVIIPDLPLRVMAYDRPLVRGRYLSSSNSRSPICVPILSFHAHTTTYNGTRVAISPHRCSHSRSPVFDKPHSVSRWLRTPSPPHAHTTTYNGTRVAISPHRCSHSRSPVFDKPHSVSRWLCTPSPPRVVMCGGPPVLIPINPRGCSRSRSRRSRSSPRHSVGPAIVVEDLPWLVRGSPIFPAPLYSAHPHFWHENGNITAIFKYPAFSLLRANSSFYRSNKPSLNFIGIVSRILYISNAVAELVEALICL